MEFAARFRAAGHALELFAPDPAGKPNPDFRTQLNDRWLTVECTALHEAAAGQRSERISTRLGQWAEAEGLAARGWIHVEFLDVDTEEAEARLAEVEQGVRRIVAAGEQAETVLGDLAKLRFFPGELGFPNPMVFGPVLERYFDAGGKTDTRRIVSRMKEKRRQLVGHGATLLVVRNHSLFDDDTIEDPRMAFGNVGTRIARALSEMPEISAVLDYEEWLGVGFDRARTFDGPLHFGVVGPDPDGGCRVALLVPNPEATVPLTPTEIGALVGPGMLW